MPCGEVGPARPTPLSWLVSMTTTPGSTAPLSSLASMKSVPVGVCAEAADARRSSSAAIARIGADRRVSNLTVARWRANPRPPVDLRRPALPIGGGQGFSSANRMRPRPKVQAMRSRSSSNSPATSTPAALRPCNWCRHEGSSVISRRAPACAASASLASASRPAMSGCVNSSPPTAPQGCDRSCRQNMSRAEAVRQAPRRAAHAAHGRPGRFAARDTDRNTCRARPPLPV